MYIVVSVFNVFSRMALSYRREHGRVTVHGIGKTAVKDVLRVFVGRCFFLLLITTLVTFPTDCKVVEI